MENFAKTNRPKEPTTNLTVAIVIEDASTPLRVLEVAEVAKSNAANKVASTAFLFCIYLVTETTEPLASQTMIAPSACITVRISFSLKSS